MAPVGRVLVGRLATRRPLSGRRPYIVNGGRRLLDVRSQGGGQFGRTLGFPLVDVLVQPALVGPTPGDRRDGEVVREVFGVGLGRLTDRTGVSHAPR